MKRLFLALVLGLSIGHAVAAPALAAVEICTAACQDSGADEDCPPTCLECGCCAQLARTLAPSPGVSAPVATPTAGAAVDSATRPPAWAPRDVFHVPIARLV